MWILIFSNKKLERDLLKAIGISSLFILFSYFQSFTILGPTLSTSTSSFEALDPHDPNLSRLANTVFSKTSEYLYGELTSTLDDYRLLEQMNKTVITKYSDMKYLAVNIRKSMGELQEKCKCFGYLFI